MSLSAHEKIEFERLTADLEFDSPELNKMLRRERATTMTYVALPKLGWWSSEIVTVFMLVLGLALLPATAVCVGLTHNFMALVFVPIGAILCWRVDVRHEKAYRKANRKN